MAQTPIRRPAPKAELTQNRPPTHRDHLNALRAQAGHEAMPSVVVDNVVLEPASGRLLPLDQLRLCRIVYDDGSYSTINVHGLIHRRVKINERHRIYHRRGCPHHASIWPSKAPTCWALEAERDGYRMCKRGDAGE